MQFNTESVVDGVSQREFRFGEVVGDYWTPEDSDRRPDSGARPLILIGHGGGQNKSAPGVVARAKRFALLCGFAAVAIDAPGHGDREKSHDDEIFLAAIRRGQAAGEPMAALFEAYNLNVAERAVPEWRAVLNDFLATDGRDSDTPVGYWGVSLGGAIGMALIASEPRIAAAVVGLIGDQASLTAANHVTIPVQMVLQWDDELIPRNSGLAVFDALASTEKTLHINSGRHADLPRFETESAEQFFNRHLAGSRFN